MPPFLASLLVWLLSLLLLAGSFFMLAGAIGIVRFPDFYMRLHAPTKASTLGVGSILLASMGASALDLHLHAAELLITLFLFLTAPISSGLLAQAALHLRQPGVCALPGSPENAELAARQPDRAQ